MRIMRKLDVLVTTIEVLVVAVRMADAVKEGLELRNEKLKMKKMKQRA